MTSRNQGHKWLTLAAMCFGLFLIMLDNTIVNVALPSIQRELDASPSMLEWTINAYVLSFAVLIMLGGKLGDRFGRKKLFLVGPRLIFTAMSVACALAPSIEYLVAFRALQGVGGALMNPLTLSIIVAAFPRRELGTAIGIWAGISARRPGDRPGARRRAGGARQLVGHLLDQRAGGHRRRPGHDLGRRRVARPDQPHPRPARGSPSSRAASSCWSGASSRPTTTLGLDLHHRLPGRGRRGPPGLRRLGGPHARARWCRSEFFKSRRLQRARSCWWPSSASRSSASSTSSPSTSRT